MFSKFATESDDRNSIKPKRKSKTTQLEYKLMLQLLEILDNLNLIIGNATSKLKSVVAGAEVTKKAGYKRLANWINERSHGSNWDVKDACNRLRAFIDKYKEVRRAFMSKTDGKFNIPEEYRLKGMTIDELLEMKCFGFNRMDKLFGERQNITPACTMEPSEDDDELDVDLPTDDISVLSLSHDHDSFDEYLETSQWEDNDTSFDTNNNDIESVKETQEQTAEALLLLSSSSESSVVTVNPILSTKAKKGKKAKRMDIDPKLIARAEEAAKEALEDTDNQPKDVKKKEWTFLLSIWYARNKRWNLKDLSFKMNCNSVKRNLTKRVKL